MKKKPLIISGIVLSALIAAIYLVVFLGVSQSVRLPRQALAKTPTDYNIPFENIEFSSSDGIPLKGWWLPGKSNALVIVLHGYGANRAGWTGKNTKGKVEFINFLESAVPLHKAGYNLLYFDLRACGESGGEKITFDKYELYDLKGALKWFFENKSQSKDFNINRIGLLGFSLGGNIALRGGLELKKLIKGGKIHKAAVIAIGPYIWDTMASKGFWSSKPSFLLPIARQCFNWILGFDISDEINPVKYIDQISPVPLMLIQSEKDEIGDVADVKAMYEKAGHPKEMIILPNASRFEHYKYPYEKPGRVLSFYGKYLLGN